MDYREVGEFLFDVSMLATGAVNPAVPLLSLPHSTGVYDRLPEFKHGEFKTGKYVATLAADAPIAVLTGLELLHAAQSGRVSPQTALYGAYLLQRLGHFVKDYSVKPQ